jgi:hypothetical protein
MFTRLAVGLVQAFSPCVYHAQMIQQYFYFFTQIKGNLYCKKGTRNMNNTRQDDSAVFNCRALRLPRTNDSALFNCRGLGNSAVGYMGKCCICHGSVMSELVLDSFANSYKIVFGSLLMKF